MIMITQKDIDLLEDYLDAKLNSEELESFNERRKNDPEFAQLIHVRQMIGDAWTSGAEYLDAKKWVTEAMGNRLKKKSRFRSNVMWYSLAASIIIIIGITIYFKFISSTPIDQDLFVAGDTTYHEIELQYTDTLTYKASIDSLVSKYKLSDTIMLSWKVGDHERLFIYRSLDDSLFYTIDLEDSQETHKVAASNFIPGLFYWSLDDLDVKQKFEIIAE